MQLADQAVNPRVCNRSFSVRVARLWSFMLTKAVEDDVATLVAFLNQFVLKDVNHSVGALYTLPYAISDLVFIKRLCLLILFILRYSWR